jgi:site-specific recombinase XerD
MRYCTKQAERPVSMATKKATSEKWVLSSVQLQDSFTDFILSRQAALCSENTILFYRFTCGQFVKWLEGQNVTRPDETSARHVRAYLAELAGRGLSDRTVFDHAGGIRTMLKFWYAEKYLSQPITFDMPKVAQKRLLSLDADTLLFQTKGGGRFTGKGFREIFVRLSQRAGIPVNAHVMRRTFTILSLRAGMSPLHLQALLGHASLEMVRHYAQMVDDDLLQAHKAQAL